MVTHLSADRLVCLTLVHGTTQYAETELELSVVQETRRADSYSNS